MTAVDKLTFISHIYLTLILAALGTTTQPLQKQQYGSAKRDFE
jgi:hypothetical protein